MTATTTTTPDREAAHLARQDRRLRAIARINAERTVSLSVYEDHGAHDRFSYLQGLADETGHSLSTVCMLADLLGPDEDFDGLVTGLEDSAPGEDF